MTLRFRHFVIGVTGGIAAYKTCELVRRLQDHGATVQVVMTEGGTQFVTPTTFQALSGRPVYTSAWSSPAQSGPDNGMPHIDLAREADAILVAPASADFISRIACGQTSDLLSTMCLARDVPLLIAPAMNRQMWQSPATQRNIDTLRADGVDIIGPASGAQACGETGDGRMVEAEELLKSLIERFGRAAGQPDGNDQQSAPNIRGVLQGRHVVITAGPTFEPIDPVRGITNRSSGKMGFALAKAAAHAGANVTLIAGPVNLPTPEKVARQDVTTAVEMFNATTAVISNTKVDCFISVAAVADWRPKTVGSGKLKKEAGARLDDIEWVENPDILSHVAHLPSPPFCVGFAAETGSYDNLRELLPTKRLRKNVPLIVGNIGETTFGQDQNQIMLCDSTGVNPLPSGTKDALAQHLIFEIAKRLAG